jgi:predicted nucleotidyltransferase
MANQLKDTTVSRARDREKYVKLIKKSLDNLVLELSNPEGVFSGKVERISMFGSYPRRKPDLFSDLDILVVMRTEKPFLERLKEVYSSLSLPVDADILCYTPEEFEVMKKRPFFQEALKKEIVLYEKGNNRRRKEMA